MPTTIINNLATNYQRGGTGPTMLMLHGWGDTLHTFDQIAEHLIQSFDVVRLDLPGHGQTEIPEAAWTLNDYVDFVNTFISKLGLHVDVLLGHSFGGRIVIKGIAANTFRPDKCIIIAGAGIRQRSLFRIGFSTIAKIGRLMTSLPFLASFREKMRTQLYQAAGSDFLNTGPLQKTYLNVIREDLARAATVVTVPTQLIWGDHDTATPLSAGLRFSQLIPNSSLNVIHGAGHFVHQEHPQQVAAIIMQPKEKT